MSSHLTAAELNGLHFGTANVVQVWLRDAQFMRIFNEVRGYTLLPPWNLYILWQLAKAAPAGSFWECGVFRGGVSYMLSQLRRVQMFDTFAGIPVKGAEDGHNVGDFACGEEDVKRFVKNGSTHRGLIPSKFFEDRIAFCHCDVDQGQATWDVLSWVYPRLVKGGVLVVDEGTWPGCLGAGKAVSEYFRDKLETPFATCFGPAIVTKL